MFPTKLMDQLAEILREIIGTDGNWTEKSEYIAKEMRKRKTDGDLEEFISWYYKEK